MGPLTRSVSRAGSGSRQEAVEETMHKFEQLIDNFATKPEELDQFKQNDEKIYEDQIDEF